MDNNIPQPINQNVSTPPPVSPQKNSRFKNPLYIALAVVGVIIVLLLGYLMLRGNSIEPYTFSINDKTIPQEEVAEIYAYYQTQDADTYSPEVSLDLIEQMYVENYVMKQEYLQLGNSESELESKVASEVTTGSLSNAPDKLLQLSKENMIMRRELPLSIGVQIRSGYLLTLGVTESVSASESSELINLMTQRLNYYKNIMALNIPFTEIQKQFEADQQIASRPKITQNSSMFVDMTPSHPLIPGDDFIDKVFETPQNTTSDIFKFESDSVMYYGIVHPTSPLIRGDYGDMRKWLADKKSSVTVVTDFTAIK